MNSFVVKSPSDLSDHCLIWINIQCENKSSNVEEETLWSLPGTFKWSDQNDDLYIDSLITAWLKWAEIWWEAPMEGSVLSFLKAEWKMNDRGLAQCCASRLDFLFTFCFCILQWEEDF
jgi:hypothetical protein